MISSQMMTNGVSIAIAKNRKLPFDWHIYICFWLILKAKVKPIHISTVNISRMVTDMAILQLPSNMKFHMDFQ